MGAKGMLGVMVALVGAICLALYVGGLSSGTDCGCDPATPTGETSEDESLQLMPG